MLKADSEQDLSTALAKTTLALTHSVVPHPWPAVMNRHWQTVEEIKSQNVTRLGEERKLTARCGDRIKVRGKKG